MNLGHYLCSTHFTADGKLSAGSNLHHRSSLRTRDRRQEFHAGCNFEDRIKACDFEDPPYKVRCVHKLEPDASRFSLLAQLQHQSQTAGINGAYPREVEYDRADP